MEATSKQILAIPALPIIQSNIMALAPTFNGGRHDGHMNMLYARVCGEKSAEELQSYLKEQQIEAKEDNDFAIFLQDLPEQTTACAAYMASLVLLPPNLGEFLQPVKKESEQSSAADQETTEPEFNIDEGRMIQALGTKLALAQANADIFALIAKELPENLTLEGYRQEITRLFHKLAPLYHQRVQLHYPNNVQFSLLAMNKDRFTFSCSTGYVFHFDIAGLDLRLGGIQWYGQGKLIGQRYMLPVSYFPESVNELLQ